MRKNIIFLLFLIVIVSAKQPLADIDGYFSSPRSTALGMAGAADKSTDDIFINQFGLAGLKSFGIYGSGYQLFADTNFYNGQIYFPVGNIGLGLGYRLKSIDNVQITPPDIIGLDGRPDSNRIDYTKYQQSVFYLAFGYSGFLGWKNLDLGLTYKNYSVNNSFPEMAEVSAQGNNIDIGVLAHINKIWSLSLIGRNVMIGNGVNGSLVWRNGTQEKILSSTVIGNKSSFDEGKLLYFLDANYYEEEYYPLLFNMGVESRILNDILVLRGGLRQYSQLTGESERRVFYAVSAGLGLTPWPGINFDYAYYPGDDLALEAVHYAGAGFNFEEIFRTRPKKIKPEEPLSERLQIVMPPDYWVSDTAELIADIQIQGYPTFSINETEYELEPRGRRFSATLNLEPGFNLLQITAGDRLLKRNILRLKTAEELAEENLDKDIVQNVFAPEHREEFIDEKIQLGDFAAYVVQTLDLHLPKDFDGIFNDMDILYFNGFLGKTSEGLLQTEDGYFSVGRLAEMLARIDGYSDVLDASTDTQLQAIKILISTGYYTAADFAPRDAEVTLSKAQSLFMRTAAVNQRLVKSFNGYPLVWLDRAELNSGRLRLNIYNAERFEKYSWTYGRQNVTGNIDAEGYVSINIAPLRRKEDMEITINVHDRPGKVWQFRAEVPAVAIIEPRFLVRTEPRSLEAGLRLKINFGVPADIGTGAVQLSSTLLKKPLNLKQISESLWQTDFAVPDTAKSGEYILTFKIETLEKTYEKKFPVQVRGFENTQQQSSTAQSRSSERIITKTSMPVYQPSDLIVVYIGVVGDPAQVKEARVVFPDGSYTVAGQSAEHVWRAEIERFVGGKNEYLAAVYFQNGTVAELAGSFRVDADRLTSVAPAKTVTPAKTPVITPPTAPEKQRLNKVYYPVEIMLSPAKPQVGTKVLIRAKYDNSAVTTVYAQIKGQKLPMKKTGAIWQTEYTLPATKQDVYIQIYAQDNKGNLSMMEKLLAL